MDSRQPVKLSYKPQLCSFRDATSVDEEGNNLLHIIASDDKNIYPKAKTIVATLGEDLFRQLALSVNFNGDLPVDLVEEEDGEHPAKVELRAELFNFMRPMVPPISQPVDLNTVMSKYSSVDNPALNYHLTLACKVANIVSSTIKESDTHPQANEYSVEQQRILSNNITVMREEISEKCEGKSRFEALQIHAEIVQKYRIGNCAEFALLSMYELLRIDININVEVYSINNGDHVITILGRHPHSSNFKTWGPGAVVCDSHLRRVYPAKYIPEMLKDFRVFTLNGVEMNFCFNFNPRYHALGPEFKFPKPNKVKPEQKLKDLGFFAHPTVVTHQAEAKASQHVSQVSNG